MMRSHIFIATAARHAHIIVVVVDLHNPTRFIFCSGAAVTKQKKIHHMCSLRRRAQVVVWIRLSLFWLIRIFYVVIVSQQMREQEHILNAAHVNKIN